ncbi:MAG: 5-carboxymethyl-2-hydroxymuconate Delta-isomerase [Marinicellaceae bacterium]
MPHLTLEYTQNLKVDHEFSDLLNKMHQCIASIGAIKIENFKSRVYRAENFFIATGDENNGFVHLDVRFLEGRSQDVKQKIGEQMNQLLVDWFQPLNKALKLQITVEINDIKRAAYFKYPKGTLTQINSK